MEALLNHLSFESMKVNPYVNYESAAQFLTAMHGVQQKTDFMRKGKVGGWKEELSPDSVLKLNEWIARNRIPGLWDDILL